MQPGNVYYEGYTREVALRSVGPGWASLINSIFDALPDGVKVIQVKQKLGILRIFSNPADKEFSDFVNTVVEASRHICEGCGDVGCYRSNNGCIRTFCTACNAQHCNLGMDPWL